MNNLNEADCSAHGWMMVDGSVKCVRCGALKPTKGNTNTQPNLRVRDDMDVGMLTNKLVGLLDDMDISERVQSLNTIRKSLHAVSPFKAEPVDCVQWVLAESVEANDYNPNAVAPPEMELLKVSIMEDGYTQPIVSWQHDDKTEVIDGFHRNRVGKECPEVYRRIHGYLPISIIKPDRENRNDRIASTIRNNRARGKHKIEAMSYIVV